MEHSRTTKGTHDGHRYRTVSTHNTSEGRVAYRHCACGMWHIELFNRVGEPVRQASIARRQYPVEPVVDAPVKLSAGGHLAMSAHVVRG